MCGRYALWGIDLLGRRFLVVDPAIGFRSKFNIAPGTRNPVVVNEDGRNEIREMHWGIAGTDGVSRINIRAERFRSDPAKGRLSRLRRCIVPANGYFEWKKEGSRKAPYFIYRENRELLGFAGLWSGTGTSPSGTPPAYAILTARSGGIASRIHDRMPVILAREQESSWLAGDPYVSEGQGSAPEPAFPEGMTAYRVSARVNSADAEGEDLVLPVTGWSW